MLYNSPPFGTQAPTSFTPMLIQKDSESPELTFVCWSWEKTENCSIKINDTKYSHSHLAEIHPRPDLPGGGCGIIPESFESPDSVKS